MKSKSLFLIYFFVIFSISHSCTSKDKDPVTTDFSIKDVSYTIADSLRYQSYINIHQDKKDLPTQELLIQTASYFLETPYVGGTLDKEENEHLVVNLREFDCTTFVESCLAMVQALKSKDPSFSNYCKILQRIRYRNGIITDYSSRLHYMTDWAYENEHTTQLLKNKSIVMNGILSTKNINFMSTHPNAYRSLKNNLPMQQEIENIEQKISQRKSYIFIPKNEFATQQHKLKNGDIVVFATSIDGLDYSHVGFVYIPDHEDIPTFIHASSSSAMKVLIQKESLLDYINKSKSCTGVTILRIN